MRDDRPNLKLRTGDEALRDRLKSYAASLGISIPEAIDMLLKIVNR